MTYSALEVAKYIIHYEAQQGRTVSNLRLQKLLRQSIVKHCIRRSQISKSQEFRSA